MRHPHRRVGAYEKGESGRLPLSASSRAETRHPGPVKRGRKEEPPRPEKTLPPFVPRTSFPSLLAAGVRAGLAAEDLLIAEQLLWLRDGNYAERPGLADGESQSAGRILAAALPGAAERVKRGTFITTGRIEDKRYVAESLPAGVKHPLLEMETCAVARAASAAGVRLMAVRGVSDDAGEELGFSIAEFTDRDLNVSVPKILLTLARRPWILPQLIRLTRNSRFAGERLAEAVMTLLEAPPAALREPA